MKSRLRKKPPDALLSRQWQSESTLSVRAAGASDPVLYSPSDTPAPPPKCCDGKFIPSASLPLTHPPFIYGENLEFGAETSWEAPGVYATPDVGIEVVCDEDSRAWRARISFVAPVEVITRIGIINNQLDAGVIEGADCNTLRKMAEDLAFVMSNAGRPDPDRDDYWLPEGFLEVQENIHVAHMLGGIAASYQSLVGRIEGISRSCRKLDQSEAETEMQREIAEAIALFDAELRSLYEGEVTHIPPDDFLQVHQDFLGRWVAMVDAEAEIKGCL